MRQIKICWIQHGGEYPWATQIAAFLKDYGCKVVFVCFLNEIHQKYLKDGHESILITDIFNRDPLTESEIADLDSKYGPPGVQDIALSDVHLTLLYQNDQAKKQQIASHALKWWERFLEVEGIDYLLVRDTGSFSTRAAYAVAKKRGFPLYGILNIGPSDDTFTMADVGEYLIWHELLVEDCPYTVTHEQKMIVQNLIAQRIQQCDAPAVIMKSRSIKNFIRFLYLNYRKEIGAKLKSKHMEVAFERLNRQKELKAFVWHKVTSRIIKYDSIVEDEPYVYLPLFFEGEWQNLVGAPFASRNLHAFIKEVSSSLPVGIKLYIKEHPAVPGELSISNLRRLQCYPNVRLIEPSISGQVMIRGAKAVIALMSTSGWEAFLMQKPLIVMGNTWYTPCDIVYRVNDPNQISVVLREALAKGDSVYKEREEEWYHYISRVLSSSLPGALYNYQLPFFSNHNLENSKVIAASLRRRIETRFSEFLSGQGAMRQFWLHPPKQLYKRTDRM